MAKKTASSTSQLETKSSKNCEKTAKSAIAVTQSLLNHSSSCSKIPEHSTAERMKTKSTEHPDLCCVNTGEFRTANHSSDHKHSGDSKIEIKKGPRTRIIVRYDVGFNNTLSIRGKGANLSWDKGVLLKNIKPDEWIWETESSFNTCEFKVLINDIQYEIGENHPLSCGASIQYTPKF